MEFSLLSFLMLLSFFATVRPMNQRCKNCGFFKVNDYRLSHDCRVEIDRDVSTAHCSSSAGDSVDLLSRTICTTVVVNDWCITNLTHDWWVSIQSIVGIVRGRH